MAKKKQDDATGVPPAAPLGEGIAIVAILDGERRDGETPLDTLRRIIEERNTYMNHSHKAFVP